jgi:hypothetical protein
MEPDIEVSYNEETSVLQITRKPPRAEPRPEPAHTLDDELNTIFGEDSTDEVDIPNNSIDDIL